MTIKEKDKLIDLMRKERNSYSEHTNMEVAKLYGKMEGVDYILSRLITYKTKVRMTNDYNKV